jgi:hypothetical protein
MTSRLMRRTLLLAAVPILGLASGMLTMITITPASAAVLPHPTGSYARIVSHLATSAATADSFPRSCSETSRPSFTILNRGGEVYAATNEPVSTQYAATSGQGNPPYFFCPSDETTNGGVEYYYYVDTYGDCMTANASNDWAYQAPCGEYPASQEWHYNYNGTSKDGTIENYYTSECLWFTGQPPKANDVINIGGCRRNQNNTVIQEGD